jgi:Carboxypeptidase regulatory-like domain
VRWIFIVVTAVMFIAAACASEPPSRAGSFRQLLLIGRIVNAQGRPVGDASVVTSGAKTVADNSGVFRLWLTAGNHKLAVSAQGYAPVVVPVTLTSPTELTLQLSANIATTVNATAEDSFDFSDRHFWDAAELRQQNPGAPGVPVSVPGLPSATASGGVKAPQYFAPGVAGDHGESIAQYIRVGDFLFPNNLPANAHGNGYADPNLLIAAAIGAVESHGDNAVNAAVAYALQPRLGPVAQLTFDPRNYDLVLGWSPANAGTGAWLAFEAAGGSGYLRLPEGRKQYKLNGERSYTIA